MSDTNDNNDYHENMPNRSQDVRKFSNISGVITEECEQDCLSPGSILHFCERKILLPYLRLLALTGLRACPPSLFPPLQRNINNLFCFGNPDGDGRFCAHLTSILGFTHLVFVLLAMAAGHVIQYMACFQPIGGFHSEFGACSSFYVSTITNIIPAIMQLAAHCHILWLFRVQEMEKLPNLMERVFLLSSACASNGISRHYSLVHQIWLLILSGTFWTVISITYLTWLISIEEDFELSFVAVHSPKWLNVFLRAILIVGMSWQEVSKAAIITSYCIHAYLLSYYAKMLRCSLICRGQSPLDWMREMTEFQGLLTHFNDDLSPSAIAVVIIAIVWAVTGIMKLISFPLLQVFQPWNMHSTSLVYNDTHFVKLPVIGSDEAILLQNLSLPKMEHKVGYMSVDLLNLLSILLKLLLAFSPLILAARVTNTCRTLRSAGHIVRARPFAYRDAPPSPSLDSLLLYTSSLRLSATLLPCFQFPVSPSCLCISIILSLTIPLLFFSLMIMLQSDRMSSV